MEYVCMSICQLCAYANKVWSSNWFSPFTVHGHHFNLAQMKQCCYCNWCGFFSSLFCFVACHIWIEENIDFIFWWEPFESTLTSLLLSSISNWHAFWSLFFFLFSMILQQISAKNIALIVNRPLNTHAKFTSTWLSSNEWKQLLIHAKTIKRITN